MFDFSVFPMDFRMRTQNCTSIIHNLSYFFPISKWDTTMNSWLNPLTIYINILLLKVGTKYNLFAS